MKRARGTHLAAVAVLSLSFVFATSASAASRSASPRGPAQPRADVADVYSGWISGERQVIPDTVVTTSVGERAVSGTHVAAPTTAATAIGRAKPRFDMDGDGRDELIVGSSADPGGFVLHVHYSGLGRRETLTPPQAGTNYFRPPYTAGDFDGDGFKDLAVAGQRRLPEGSFEQGIFVYRGSPVGLDRDNVSYLAGLHAGAFASGDVNNDGRDELALTDGGATEQRDGPFRGSVTVLQGSANGLTKDGLVVIRQVVPRWPGLAEEVFGGPGSPVAMGDFTGDGYADLVVGGTRRGDSEFDWHGVVTLFAGSAAGPDITKVTKLEGGIDLPGNSFPVDVMTMADMNQDGRADLLLGLPRHNSGEVAYLPGAVTGLSPAGLRVIDQDSAGIPGEPDGDATGGHFGYSLATGDATGDGVPDLLVGAITQTVGGVSDAGSVTLIPGTAQGPTGAGSFVYTQSPQSTTRRPDPRNSEPAEPEDYLGSSVAILDLDGTGPLEMFAESKYEDLFEETTSEPIGLITMLRLEPTVPRRDSAQPSSYRLVAVQQRRPADFADPGFQVRYLGGGVLHA